MARTPRVIPLPAPEPQGRTPKRPAKAAISSVFQSDAAKQTVADVDPLEAAVGPAPAETDAPGAETAYPAAPAKPAAQWDRATDTTRFDWAEIERTASQEGPNQAMAKLLVAARAEGASSRWPF